VSAAPKFKNHVKVSERHGAGEWKIEKLALLALMPLGLWVLSSAFTLAGAGYEAVVACWVLPPSSSSCSPAWPGR